ncbi:unnamed protein product [Ceutorhynchus assimilis]|uniref:Odorant receptor n=1 Tax=Ceutorhynchus assimilis TaxID=467358 RepID=A0A9N9MI66_9CUCU|nr:unnamed protein product [Ceutorhynchus assimilis]
MLPNISENKSRHYKITHNVHTFFIYLVALCCVLAEVIKLYQIVTDDYFIYDELIRNLVMTTFHITTMLKCVFLRSRTSAKLFKAIINYEKMVYDSANDKIISIYRELLTNMQKTRNYYFMVFLTNVVFYIAAPKFRDPYYITRNNVTAIVQQMPISSWTPIENNYWFSFIWTSGVGFYLVIFFLTTDLTINSFIMFGVCQIKILKHFISDFHYYANDIKQKRSCTKEESFRMLQKELIIMHQEILSSIRDLNKTLKKVMLIDFVPSSLQLAGVLFQTMANLSVIQCILVGQFIVTLCARIFIYCNNAQNLAVQSESVASTWYDIDWTELPHDVRKNIVFCMSVAQKPLYITVGDMGNITLETFLSIIKGAYSYMMLLNTI